METPWTSSACPPSVVLGGPARLSERWPQGAWAGVHALCRGLWPRERPEAGGGGQDRRVAAGALVPRILSLQIGRTGTRAPGSECPGARCPRSSRPTPVGLLFTRYIQQRPERGRSAW